MSDGPIAIDDRDVKAANSHLHGKQVAYVRQFRMGRTGAVCVMFTDGSLLEVSTHVDYGPAHGGRTARARQNIAAYPPDRKNNSLYIEHLPPPAGSTQVS